MAILAGEHNKIDINGIGEKTATPSPKQATRAALPDWLE
jgi:hypothetical protein